MEVSIEYHENTFTGIYIFQIYLFLVIINNYFIKFKIHTFDITCLNLSPSQQCIYPFIEVTANSDRLLLKHIARTLSAVLHCFFIRDFVYTNEGISEEITCKKENYCFNRNLCEGIIPI